MPITYIFAQTFGLLHAACCLIGPHFKKKWQMLVNSMFSVSFAILNYLLLGNALSGAIVNFIALLQLCLSLWHVQKEVKVTIWEKIIFLIAFVGAGMMGYKGPISLLPIVGAIFFMVAAFQRDEQKTRILYLFNTATWFTYDIIVGSTGALGQFASFSMYAFALYRYRNKGKKKTVEKVQ